MNDDWSTVRMMLDGLGVEVRRARQSEGFYLDDLAVNVGCDVPMLSRIENGLVCPTPTVGEALTRFLTEHRLQSSQSAATGSPALSHLIVTPTPARATHPDTSRKAMASINRENAWAIHNWIINTLTGMFDPEGVTHEQLWMLYVRLQPEPRTSQSGLRTRVSELVRGGVVQDSGRTRTMTTGRQAIVWELAKQGDIDA